MALKPCRECGTQVSTRAKTCPRCGIASPSTSASQRANAFLDRVTSSIIRGIIFLGICVAIFAWLSAAPNKGPTNAQSKKDDSDPAVVAQQLAKIEKLKPITNEARACIRSGLPAAYQSGAYGHDQVISFFMSRCFSPFFAAYQQAGYPDIAEPGFRVLVDQEATPQEWQRTLDDLKSGTRR